MLFTEFNMEDALEVRGEERYSEGLKLGTERGIEQGIEQGIERGIRALIDTCMEFCISRQDAQARIRQKFLMDEATSAVYLDKYWNVS